MSTATKTLQARIKLVDNYTRPMQTVIKQTKVYQALATKIKPVIIKAKDMASKVLAPVKAKIDALKATKQVQTILKVKDMATKVIGAVVPKLRSIAGKTFTATLKVVDMASNVINNIYGKMKSIVAMGASFAIGSGIKGVGQEQTQKLTIQRTIENAGMDKAAAKKSTDEYYKFLEEYAKKTPFSTAEVAGLGTKASVMAKGNIEEAKKLTDLMGNVKAYVNDGRTMQEVQESFFSASTGNMESLNNMLGTSYKTFEEAKEGIAKQQGGMVEQLSGTLPGLFSTILGNIQAVTKSFMGPFADTISNVSKQAISFFESMAPKAEAFGKRLLAIDFAGLFSSFDFSAVTSAFQPMVQLWGEFFTAIETKSPVVQGCMNILGTVFNTVFNMIGAVITAVSPIVKSIFTFIGEHAEQIQGVIKVLGKVWDSVWKTVGVLLQGAWGICEPILNTLFKALDKVVGVVSDICDWWNKMVELLKKPINAVVNIFKKDNDGTGSEGRNAFGSGRIRNDDTVRTLHYGEKVLTRQEADRWDRGGGNSSSFNLAKVADTVVIREEADIDKIAKGIVREIKVAKMVYCGSY